VILVRHAAVAVDSSTPAASWQLSDKGRTQSAALAERLREHAPRTVVASEAPKASETGKIIADALKLPFATAPGLHEHDRSNEPFLSGDEWYERMRRFFAEPDELVYGSETARAAGDRFAAAVAKHPDDTLIVAHGTVITLLVARHNTALDPYKFWERLEPAGYVVLGMPGYLCDGELPVCIELE
jgi:broad specificity phosphatase PhoE